MKVFCINDSGWVNVRTQKREPGPLYGDIDLVIDVKTEEPYGSGYVLERFGADHGYHVENFIPLQEDSVLEEKTLENEILSTT